MALEPDRVADVVTDRSFDAELAGQLDARQLDLTCRHAWRHDLDRPGLQGEHRVEGALLLLRRRTHDHRPLQFAVIPVDIGTRSAHQHVARLDPMTHDKTVWHRRRAAAHEHCFQARRAKTSRPPARHLRHHLEQCLRRGRRVALHLGLARLDRGLHAVMCARSPVAAELDAGELGLRLHAAQRFDEHLGIDRPLAAEVAQPRPAVAPIGHVPVVVRASSPGFCIYLRQIGGDELHRMLSARVLEIDPDGVDAGHRLGVLFLHRRHDQRRVLVGAEDEDDRSLRRYVMKPGQVGDARRVEDREGVEARGVHAGADRRAPECVLLR